MINQPVKFNICSSHPIFKGNKAVQQSQYKVIGGKFPSFGNINKLQVELDSFKEEEYFQNFLAKRGKMTKDEYQDIIHNHPSMLIKSRQALDSTVRRIDSTPEDISYMAIKIDSYLKDKYKDYRIISIGTSPAVLTEQLALMGNDVIFLPCTNFSSYDKNTPSDDIPNLQTAMNYLREKGLKNDGKKNIVIDYKSSNDNEGTLEKMTYCIGREFSYIPEANLIPVSLYKLLDDSVFDGSVNSMKKISSFLSDVGSGAIEPYTNVPHFNIARNDSYILNHSSFTVSSENKTEQEIFKCFDNTSRPLGKMFALLAFNETQNLKA